MHEMHGSSISRTPAYSANGEILNIKSSNYNASSASGMICINQIAAKLRLQSRYHPRRRAVHHVTFPEKYDFAQ